MCVLVVVVVVCGSDHRRRRHVNGELEREKRAFRERTFWGWCEVVGYERENQCRHILKMVALVYSLFGRRDSGEKDTQ